MSLSAHYTWLFFPDSVLCSILHDLQCYEPSSRTVFMSVTVWKSFLGSQGHRGEPAIARCSALLWTSAVQYSASQPVGQESLVD